MQKGGTSNKFMLWCYLCSTSDLPFQTSTVQSILSPDTSLLAAQITELLRPPHQIPVTCTCPCTLPTDARCPLAVTHYLNVQRQPLLQILAALLLRCCLEADRNVDRTLQRCERHLGFTALLRGSGRRTHPKRFDLEETQVPDTLFARHAETARVCPVVKHTREPAKVPRCVLETFGSSGEVAAEALP